MEPQVRIAELSTSEDKRSRAPGGMNVEQKINELKKERGTGPLASSGMMDRARRRKRKLRNEF